MIDQADERMKDWIRSVVTGADVSLSMPDATKPWRGVSLYLLELSQRAPPRTVKRPPLQLWLRYLVTTWSEQPEDAHRMLSDLVFAAMDHPDFEVETGPVALETWEALGLPPRPSFTIGFPLRKERTEPRAPLVRQPLIVTPSALEPFHGVVLGPNDVALVEARVRIPNLGLEARTDSRGRFEFPGVPAEARPRLLVVRAKGREISVSTSERHPESNRPFIIRFDVAEA